MRLRPATDADAPAMLGIYAPFVRSTAISFELDPPAPAEFARRLRENREHAAWLVCADDSPDTTSAGRPPIAGYAYGSRFRPRPAYRWSIEVTVYIHPAHHRRGIGLALYTSLLACLRVQGFQTATAGIALPNPASVRLHERLGFTSVGVFHAAGFKFAAWHDVLWMELALGDRPASPRETLTTAQAERTPEWSRAIAAGQALLKPAPPR